MSVCIAGVSTSGSLIFYMGEDHSLPFMSLQIIMLFTHDFGAVSFIFFFFFAVQSRVGRSELSSAIDLELFE